VQPVEDRSCYLAPEQREVLIGLARQPLVASTFFLTGGTALAVFYLHHRLSKDIDLFSRVPFDGGALAFLARSLWPREFTLVQESAAFVSFVARGTKVDLVHDPLSDDSVRPRVALVPEVEVAVDGIADIAANKLCTVASRREPKDFVDLYLLMQRCPELTLDYLYSAARKKEALFDDPPSVAYQIETNFSAVQSMPELIPATRIRLDTQPWSQFYERLCTDIYARAGR